MHIAEGAISAPVLIGGALLAGLGTAVGLKRLDHERLMLTGLMSAVFFVGSLVHVPIGPASAHLVLNGLLGMLLGWAAFPAILAALFMQAMLFQYGGLTTLGLNAACMGYGAILAWKLFCTLLGLRQDRNGLRLAAFAAGFLGVGLAALFTAAALALSDGSFWLAARLLFLAHLPVMLVEGLITMFTAELIYRVEPGLFPGLPTRDPGK